MHRDWKKLHNEKLNDQYPSSNIVGMIKSRRMRWVGHVACMGERKGIYRILVGKLEGRDHFGDPGVNGRMTLSWVFREWDVGVWTESSWLRIGTGGGHL